MSETGDGWELTSTPPEPEAGLDAVNHQRWLPATVPGTAAGALRAAGKWRPGDTRDFDAEDWWFRRRFDCEPAGPDEKLVLGLDGIATVAEVYLNRQLLLESQSMYAAHEVDVTSAIAPHNELVIRCRALTPLLEISRRPRARWRTKLVSSGNLRFFRTMLLGRAPGFAPGPAAVGPWRPVRLERRRGFAMDELKIRSGVQGDLGRVLIRGRLREISHMRILGASVEVVGGGGRYSAELEVTVDGAEATIAGAVEVHRAERWWPHTHGHPSLYEVRLRVRAEPEEYVFDVGRVGFRTLSAGSDLDRDGVQLMVNGVPIFARGAVWSPLDLANPCSSGPHLREVLQRVVDAGMNMLRIPGIGCYEGSEFHDLCDELGILVWQDFMFANLDYPDADERFIAAVEGEARAVLQALGPRPSLAVLCGGSEVAQQVAMLGLDPQLASGRLYGELLPGLVEEADVDAPYLPSAPWGGDLPFRPNAGIANYYGVGAYLRPLTDARLADVRFAAECLAFSNVPDEDTLAEIDAPGGLVVHHPAWKRGVPRDAGAGWDFEDVRDHYLEMLYDLDARQLRSVEHERYLELSREVTGEVMNEVFGEWRRARSSCNGGLVLWLNDVMPGAGWGILDHRGKPKVVYHHLRRIFAPVAIWTTDEGLAGVDVHLANDRPEPVSAIVRVSLYRDREVLVGEAERHCEIPSRGQITLGVEEVLGHFVDVSWAYKFGPPAQDLLVVSLERPSGEYRELIGQSFRLLAERSVHREPLTRLGLRAEITLAGDAVRLAVHSDRLARGVRVTAPGFISRDDAFSVEPGHTRQLELLRTAGAGDRFSAVITALNLAGRLTVSETV